MQKGYRASCDVFLVSEGSLFGGSKVSRRLRSKLAKCMGQSVRHVGFLQKRELCITIVAWGEASFVVRNEAAPSTVPCGIFAVSREQEGTGGRCRRCMQAASDWVPGSERILVLGSWTMTAP